ncbi:metal-dependent hydrolase [Chitinasiproducens palmae]|uniref:LexA-binding, inner membrane-associated putative hydrolase n=1 Tax=Chitinasiproducens palmae TaxID=1770053 RepID=A0A1H2PR89_9BURK|nr:metal-dependent hydrolase [Chitinasiproducens palmae]SDV49327.1 LexA-binding, inner membrane-associated putative hydrolase [Chitinasiproducens palmae]
MASNRAHHVTGWAAGVIAAAIVHKAGAAGPWQIWTALSFIAAVAGGTAPDWLEVAWWSRKRRLWITHRTLTHWGLGWIGLAVYTYRHLGQHPLAALGLGFACGGIMHLLADWPNPLGVPWLLGRHSLNWWNSGRCDIAVVALAWLAAFAVFDHAWLHDVHNDRVVRMFRAMQSSS